MSLVANEEAALRALTMRRALETDERFLRRVEEEQMGRRPLTVYSPFVRMIEVNDLQRLIIMAQRGAEKPAVPDLGPPDFSEVE